MTDRPDDRTQPISTGATSEQPPVGSAPDRSDAARPTAADVPPWANATWQGDGAASARPVPVAPMAPAAAYGPSVAPVAAAVAAAPPQQSWRSRVSGGRGLAVVALVVGLGLGAVGGAAATYAATHTDGTGSIADGSGGSGGFDRGGTGRFDGDGDDDFGPGGHGGPPPGGQFPDGRLPGGGQLPGGDSPQDDGTTGQLPGGGGTDANGTSQAT